MLDISGPDHISIWVSDLDGALRFYTALGFRQMARPAFDFAGAWLEITPTFQLHLIAGRQEEPHFGGSRQNHFALLVPDFQKAVAVLTPLNCIIRGPKQRPDGQWQVFINDPDSYTWEFTGR